MKNEVILKPNAAERRLLLDALFTRQIAMKRVGRSTEERRCKEMRDKIAQAEKDAGRR